ncbi:hypothetical protein ZIOFF_010905 [Zingiber officinale]|uniref:Uncharacterized protein n=1 Tax=Zingiber officinale TaxID=94328 RepID=A0A8J5LKA2_ZINOF|nr:hypothetical protein ZIOFF_010905 [Zingiber officinale]
MNKVEGGTLQYPGFAHVTVDLCAGLDWRGDVIELSVVMGKGFSIASGFWNQMPMASFFESLKLSLKDLHKSSSESIISDNWNCLTYGQVIGEEAFVRIAPTIAGVADISTAHHLFKALVGDEEGISYSLWTTYLSELLNSETWILEFIDFGGEMRRDVWHASINEIISMYEFVRDYGPSELIISMRRVIRSTANSIARLQCLQFIRRLSEDPAKLVQFSYLQTVPYGEVVLQTLALSFWDGSVFLRKWMKSPSWSDNMSVTFWRNSLVKRGIVLAKNLVVGDLSLVERAALTCKVKSRIVEKTRATIDVAMIKGIPSNIDLFKELLIPLVVVAKKFDEFRQWKKPCLTLSFLFIVYTIIFRNLLSYVLPATIVTMATTMLLLKGLKEQGRLGRSFGKVVIHDQPPSNTIQKIIAVKDAMTYIENYLQNVNIVLLKIRTILLSGQPEVTSEIAMVLLGLAIILLVIPFMYILAFVIFDLFTRELDFRRKMVIKVMKFLREWWAAVHAAPVVVLPYESTDMVGVDNTDADKTDRKDIGKRTPSELADSMLQ